MATTKYQVFKVNAEDGSEQFVVTKSKKATAVAEARTIRNAEGVSVVVKTTAGHVAFEQAARKRIKMSPKYTRVVGLPEGVTAPEGARVAYVRPRRGLALLDLIDTEVGDDEDRYGILVLETGELLDERFATTRDGGQRLKQGAPATADEPEPANA